MKYFHFALLVAFLNVLSQDVYGSNTAVDTTIHGTRLLPNYIPLQFAGNLGFLSTGIGYTFLKSRSQCSMLYGYVPSSIAKKAIHLITMKSSVQLFRFPVNNCVLQPYTGVAPTLEVGGNSFLVLPARFPRKFYHSNSLHLSFFLGLKLGSNTEKMTSVLRRMEPFIEAGAADIFLWYKITEQEIKFRQIMSMAMGVNFRLTQ